MPTLSGDEMSDAEFIADAVKAREGSVRFFDSENRAERELWVVNEFLTNLDLPYDETEVAHIRSDPPDARFRGAEFEIKEILDEGRRRHAEFKASLEKARVATSVQDLLEHYEPRDITYAEICALVEQRVAVLSDKYAPATRAQLDILFYVNLEDVHGYIQTPLPPPDELTKSGFRSVSFVSGRFSGVLMAAPSAPAFLRDGEVPKVIRKRDGD
jgi:hypothetical protein